MLHLFFLEAHFFFSLLNCSFALLFSAAAVIDGMDLVKQIEGLGSQSGAPSKTVTIRDSGELTTEPAATSD